MIAEQISANFIKQEPSFQQFPVEQGYFRSKLLVTDAFTNPLIAAASPLISLLERIQIATKLPELNALHEDIGHEIKAFYSRFHRHDYSEEFHFIANYLLCATTDEILGKTYLRLDGQSQGFAAFTPPSNNNVGPEHYFFDIVNYLLSLPEQFLDLIELAYFCLLIGFEGKYHIQSDGRIILDNLTENLFQTIQKLRTNKNHKLFKSYVMKANVTKPKLSTKKLSIIICSFVMSLIVLSHLFIQYQTKNFLENSLGITEVVQ
jgi:type IV/VI secretion system ImpK/VasF family protein